METLLSNVLAVTLLAFVVLILTAVIRQPAFRHAAWLLVLVKLCVPPFLVVAVVPAPSTLVEVPIIEISDVSEPIEYTPIAVVPVEDNSLSLWTIGCGLWIAGAVVWWFVVAVRIVKFRRVLRRTTPASDETDERIADLASKLGLRRMPVVRMTDLAIPPFVWAIFGRARIVLPRSLWEILSPAERDAVLAHELAHLRRGDEWVRRLELIVIGVYWWFPVAWWAMRKLRDAEESCCDGWVLWALPESATPYATALVSTVSFVSSPARMPIAASGAATFRGLQRRLTMILKQPPARGVSRPMAVALFAIAMLVIPFRLGSVLADELVQKEKPKPTPAVVPGEADPKSPIDKKVILVADELKKMSGQSNQLDALRDELELLTVQSETKKLQVQGAEVSLQAAQRRFERMKQLLKNNTGSQAELDDALAAVEALSVQVKLKTAELREHEVRMNQVARRLNVAGSPKQPAPIKNPNPTNEPVEGGKKVPPVNKTPAPEKVKAPNSLPDLLNKYKTAIQESEQNQRRQAEQIEELTRKLQILEAELKKSKQP